jgi:hypothetical protein
MTTEVLERRRLARIRELMQEWADQHEHRATMRDELVRLDVEINRLAPIFKRVVTVEYLNGDPQKTKAARMGLCREQFSRKLQFSLEQLDYVMFVV